MKKLIISAGIIILAISFSFGQTVYYVNGSVSSSGNGTSWGTAFKTIQEGINAAYSSLSTPSSQTAQVWVKQGTYYVYTSSTANTISMKEGVKIYGGFNGTETSLAQRDYINNETIIDGHQSSGSTNRVKHVVSALGVEVTTNNWNNWTNGLLDGFTITGGYITGGAGKSIMVTDPSQILSTGNNTAGAGVLIFKSAPSVANCKITGNDAPKGGGMYVVSATSFPSTNNPKASIVNCEFSNNTAVMRGGGVSIDVASEPVFERCKFMNNSCSAKGGGVYIDWVCPQSVFVNCLFAENSAFSAGALGADGSSSPVLVNCTVTNNTSTDVGAGLYTGSYNADGTASNEPILINCIVIGNHATWGGPVDLRIWHDDYFYVSHSILGTGFTSFGSGILYNNPTFNSDYSLTQSSAGVDAGVTSDVLDPGNYIPTIDINGNVRDSNPDMGCFEYKNNTGISFAKNTNSQFDIYPNPSSDFFTIKNSGNNDKTYQMVIYDNIGKAVFSEKVKNESRVNISDLRSGIYVVTLTDGKQQNSQKLIIQ